MKLTKTLTSNIFYNNLINSYNFSYIFWYAKLFYTDYTDIILQHYNPD